MSGHYVVKPKADRDLDDYADYLAEKGTVEVALRFYDAARETFSLLATQPRMGWEARLNHPPLKSLRVFRVTGFEQMLYTLPAAGGWSRHSASCEWFAQPAGAFPTARGDRVTDAIEGHGRGP